LSCALPNQSMNDLELMRLRLDVLYTYDDRGRLLLSNEPIESARVPGPELAIALSGNCRVMRYGPGLKDELVDRLEAIPADHLTHGGVDVFRGAVEAMLRPFGDWEHSGGPAYRFPHIPDFSEEAVEITSENRGVFRDDLQWYSDEYDQWGRGFAIVRGGSAVSACYSSRIDDLSAEAGLWTHPDFRGRGLARYVTQSWAAGVFESGRIPFYSTSFDNLASQSVARKLGLIQIGQDMAFRLSLP
ncbi:MAG: GNAT family N-acetyltransferase, partial [Thermomicrobiales bacterium]